tara:strand:+ start:2197 stop:3801 length:1605 start_codon:yes stop_codon:yes gene_type:complete
MFTLLSSAISSSTASDTTVDVVVVGAGYAGLAAAHALNKAGLDFVVLEAASRPGGRIRNYLPSTGEYDVVSDSAVEVGGTFVSPSHTALLTFAADFGVPPFNTSRRVRPLLDGARVTEPADAYPWWYWGVDTESSMGSSVLHTQDGTVTFSTPQQLRSQLKGRPVFVELEAAGKVMETSIAPLSCEAADDLWPDFDGITFEGWIRQHVQHEEGRNVLRAMCRGMIAQEPAQVSFLSTAKSLKGCWSAGDDDQYRMRGGSQAPLLAATKALGASKVRLRSAVRSIRALSGAEGAAHGGRMAEEPLEEAKKKIKPRYEVSTADGGVWHARYVIATGSPPALLGISMPASLPSADAQLLQRMPMGESAKLFFFYTSAWWRAEGLSANVLATDGYTACMDHSAYDATNGGAALMCWLEGATNLAFFDAPNATKVREDVLTFLQTSLNGDKRVRAYTSHVALNWPDDKFARGAYTGFFTPGVQSQPHFWGAFARSEKMPGLFVAGADYYAGLGNGYMEGAVRSGEAAAATCVQRMAMRS